MSPRQRLTDCGAVASSVTPPRIAASGALTPFDLGDATLHDELTLEAAYVTGAARDSSVRNLELTAAHLDGADLAGGRLPRLALRNCRITGGSLANAKRTRSSRVACELRGCDLEGARAVERLRGARMPYADVLAAAASFAGALGIGIMAGDQGEDR